MKIMRRMIYSFAILFLSFFFVACNDNNDTDDEWRDLNREAYQKITTNPEYEKLIPVQGGPSGVYKRVIKSGSGTETPIQTSQVKVYYKGYYYNGTVFEPGTSAANDETTATFLTSGVVRGFSIALQTMVVGDRWEIVMPYDLGYRAGLRDPITGAVIFKGYTTLYFEVELVEINQHPY